MGPAGYDAAVGGDDFRLHADAIDTDDECLQHGAVVQLRKIVECERRDASACTKLHACSNLVAVGMQTGPLPRFV